jgi:hypothetical protein
MLQLVNFRELDSTSLLVSAMQSYANLAHQFGNLTIFSETAFPLAFVILAFDLTLSAVHSYQELRGHMWRYVGAIEGVRIPDSWGVALFFVALTVLLWAVGIVGIVGVAVAGESVQAGAVWCMIGLRISDSWYLHYKLVRQGFEPNPGLPSVPLYVLEAIVLALIFWPALFLHPIAVPIGFGAGWLFFFTVMPTVKCLRLLFPMLGQEAWHAGQAAPLSAR